MTALAEVPLDYSKSALDCDKESTNESTKPSHQFDAHSDCSVSSQNSNDGSVFEQSNQLSDVCQSTTYQNGHRFDLLNKTAKTSSFRDEIISHSIPVPSASITTPTKLHHPAFPQSTHEIISTPPSRSSSRPFNMYPMDTFSLYNYPISHSSHVNSAQAVQGMGLSGVKPSMLSPTSPGTDNGYLPLTLTPLTSHLLQRRRRTEGRSNPDSSSKKPTNSVQDDKKDETYWERRRKNNDAAKRSRDARRCKEEEIAMRAAFLEQENLKLRAQVAILKNETAKLHYMLYSRV